MASRQIALLPVEIHLDSMEVITFPYGSIGEICCELEGNHNMILRDTLTGDSCRTLLTVIDSWGVCDNTSFSQDLEVDKTYYSQEALYDLPTSSAKQVMITDYSGLLFYNRTLSAQQDYLDLSFLPSGQIFVVSFSSMDDRKSLKIFSD